MALDLSRLDRITDEDEALDALEDYVEELVDEFVESPEGEAYLAAYPEMEDAIGGWIDQQLYLGYAYLSVTLPNLTKNHVETIVTQLFPQKIALLVPEDANTTIPELIAFWEFLKRVYKHRHATKILSFLQKIQPRFPVLMNDSGNFGIAKSFLSAGMTAGFDMTTEEGIQAFQEQYNQSLRDGTGSPLPAISAMLSNFNLPANPLLDTDPSDTMPSQAEVSQLVNLLAQAIMGGGPLLELASSSSEPETSFVQELRSTMWEKTADELPTLTDEEVALLNQQTLTATEPGTILQDFQTLLEFIGEKGLPVSGTYHLFPQSLLPEINQRLSQPIQMDMKRPMQKSYPYINGLYLLLRATGLGQIVSQGKKNFLKLNSEILQSWNQLNPTEKYFSLLEAWMIRADEEMLGERRSPLNEGTKCVQFWRFIPDKGQTFSKFADQQNLNYHPELHNLALLHLFGFIQLESGKPEPGKGWRVKKIQRSPFGDAMMQVIVHAFLEQDMRWGSETNPAQPFGELQPAFQPYFPEWQNSLAVLQTQFREAVYVFKVSLGKAWRRIAISSDMTLADLSGLILDSVEFDSDHLDMFRYRSPNGRTIEIQHPYSESSPSTDEVRIGELLLAEGGSMTYIFDFGDWWEFQVQLEQIKPEGRSAYGEILERHGKAPEQYPDWDEE